MVTYRRVKFKTRKEAEVYRRWFKRVYGYKPNLFTRFDKGKVIMRFFAIPKGLRRIN